MQVICKKTTSEGFDLKEVRTIFSTNFDYGGKYGLELEKEYIVMGMATYKETNCRYYLIDTNGSPDWYPYLLFEMSNNSLPQNWFVKIDEKREDFDFYNMIGFDELCNKENFYFQLLERDEEAMRIYFRRKIELEKELEEQ